MNKVIGWRLTRIIFDYWCYWMNIPHETILWSNSHDNEGLFWYDGHHATFFYLLNVEWYRMNNKLYAGTRNREPFDEYLCDFDEEYLNKYYP
jgi:homoserine trans-succinylase